MAALIKRQRFGSPDKMIVRLQKGKIPHSIRQGSECTEIIIGNTCFTFTSTRNFPRNKLFLFNSVRRDVRKFLENRSDIIFPPEHEVTRYNINYDDSFGKVCGTDLNHAYWRIAYVKGIISQRTYNHGLTEGCKALRLATLSVLGREKKFKRYDKCLNQDNNVDFSVVEELIVQPADPLQQKIFKYIRLVCYQMMHELSLKLKDDFEAYKTDCIYYRDTEENVKIVHNYLRSKGMDFKHLDYFE